MAAADDQALAEAAVFLSIVPPDQAVGLAERMAGAIRRCGSSPLYVDLNAISPATARAVGDALEGSGGRYVDGSIIGPPPREGGSGTSFYLAGPNAQAAMALEGFGLRVKRLEGEIGAASALKMSYAGITKGISALGAAMILAAEREGAGPALREELAESQAGLLQRFSTALPDMLPKAYRFAPEMREIAAFLGEDDPAAGIYAALAAFYEQVAAKRDDVAAVFRGFLAP